MRGVEQPETIGRRLPELGQRDAAVEIEMNSTQSGDTAVLSIGSGEYAFEYAATPPAATPPATGTSSGR